MGPGQLFFALRGPNFDAHEKLDEAQAAGAVAAVVERAMPSRLPQLLVADTRAALGQLARAWRQRFDIPVLAVTGSAGKTTVKEMLAAIMRTQGPVLATRGNFNNDIGLPLTLFQLDASHRAAVLEMGANHVGDITLLVAIARPHIGVITLCAPGHLEGFGSIEGVARTKGEMFAGLPDDGIAILNADDAQAPLWRELAGKRRVSSFGLSADFRAENIQATADGSVFTLRSPAGAIEITLKHRGLHNVRNALAAAAAASAAGVSLADIQRGLAEAGIVNGRLQYRAGSRRLSHSSTTATTPIRLRGGRDRGAGPPSRRRAGWCSATCASSGPMPSTITAKSARRPPPPASRSYSPTARWRAMPRSVSRASRSMPTRTAICWPPCARPCPRRPMRRRLC